MKTILPALFVFFCSLVVAGTEAPPSQPFEARTWPASMTQKPARGITFGNWPVDFEKTTLDDVVSRAKKGFIQHAGDAGESFYWLCYSLTEKIPARVWISSRGEMGGEGHLVNEVVISAVESGPPTAQCPALPLHMRPLLLQGKVQLGMRERTLARVMGTPSHRRDSRISFDFEGKVAGDCPGGFDVLNSLVLRVDRGHVGAIYASQLTSC